MQVCVCVVVINKKLFHFSRRFFFVCCQNSGRLACHLNEIGRQKKNPVGIPACITGKKDSRKGGRHFHFVLSKFVIQSNNELRQAERLLEHNKNVKTKTNFHFIMRFCGELSNIYGTTQYIFAWWWWWWWCEALVTTTTTMNVFACLRSNNVDG